MTHLDRRFLAAVARGVAAENPDHLDRALRGYLTLDCYRGESHRELLLADDLAWTRLRARFWQRHPHLLRAYGLATTPRGWVRRRWPKVVDKLYRPR